MRRTARNRIIAGALAIAATTAPTASARPNLQPATAQGQGTTEASAARSNHDHPPTPAAHVQVAAKEASTLEAMNRAKARDLAVRSYPPQAGGTYASTNTRLYATAVHPPAVAALTTTSPDQGFDYGDAGVGAAITAAIALLITGRGLAIRKRSQRPQRAGQSTATVTSAHDLHETGDLR